MTLSTDVNRRILVVDDNPAIHDDFRKILGSGSADNPDLAALEAQLFGEPTAVPAAATAFAIESALQGERALALVTAAAAAHQPFALAFVDMRMPPGIDGLETIERLWAVDPELQVVICSAFSDYSWDDVRARLGERDGLLIIKKPFDPIEVIQCAHALTAKWQLALAARARVEDLESEVRTRTAELEASNLRLASQLVELAQMETELRLAQKLESVGRLAAGIAHEINTPIQFASDTAQFLREGFGDLLEVVSGHAAVSRLILDGQCADAAARSALEAEARLDLTYLVDEIPAATRLVLEGLDRVATIVRAMKGFAHPGQDEMMVTDLNRAVESTLAIARSEYRFVAELVTDYGELPPVRCRGGEINQAVLNLVINAAHAIGDAVAGTPRRGTITVTTRRDGDWVGITVADDGVGIPEAIRDKVFDPFFTTKEVGKGTGQGLALARSAIARHGGTLTFDSVVGHGTRFEIRIPVAGVDVEPAALAASGASSRAA